jgi:hypothetical protein
LRDTRKRGVLRNTREELGDVEKNEREGGVETE